MLALKGKCISPSTGKPYIVSSRGGKENSVEGLQVRYNSSNDEPPDLNLSIPEWSTDLRLQSGITHVFVVEFASTADRDYYALKDPLHLEFGAFIGTVASKAIVVDFSSNIFE
jgi:Stress responsive A/B Barrel Domain